MEVSPSLGFQHAVQRAVINAQTSERNLIAGPHVLIALFALQDCHAVYLLKRQGVTRLDIMEYVSHGGLDYSDDDYEADDDYELEGGDDDSEDLTPAKALEKFSVNLNEEAQEGRIDPMVGRVKELTRTIHILSRRRKNNPVFVGDAGVGKTAIAEGLARAIQQGDVPEPLQGAVVYSLDVGALIAGTRYRGDFENRLKGVIRQLEEMPHAILLLMKSTLSSGRGPRAAVLLMHRRF